MVFCGQLAKAYSCVVCCGKLNNKTIFCEYIYSEKLGNLRVKCLYFHCTVAHWEESVSAKKCASLDDVMGQSELEPTKIKGIIVQFF